MSRPVAVQFAEAMRAFDGMIRHGERPNAKAFAAKLGVSIRTTHRILRRMTQGTECPRCHGRCQRCHGSGWILRKSR